MYLFKKKSAGIKDWKITSMIKISEQTWLVMIFKLSTSVCGELASLDLYAFGIGENTLCHVVSIPFLEEVQV
jgi:hypothetical protein